MMNKFEDLFAGCMKTKLQDKKKYKSLALGQNPIALVITCSDSRVDPALIMRCGPGEIFVTRNVANLVPVYDSKGIEHANMGAVLRYAVVHLNVQHIIIMGHSGCGGINACLQMLRSGKKEEYISTWLEMIESLAERVLDEHSDKSSKDQTTICEKENIFNSLENLKTYPWINKQINKGFLKLHGWYFNIENAEVEVLI